MNHLTFGQILLIKNARDKADELRTALRSCFANIDETEHPILDTWYRELRDILNQMNTLIINSESKLDAETILKRKTEPKK